MPRTTQNPDPDLDELPGFGAPTEEEFPETGEFPDPGNSQFQETDQADSPIPPTTSESLASPPASAPERPSEPSRPTATSTEPDPELQDGLAYLAGGLFELVGHFLNRMVRIRRRQPQSTLWLVSDEEAEAFAAPMARIAERRLPDELKGGDAKDLIIAGSVAVEYSTHNAAGIPGVEPRAPQPILDHEALAKRMPPPTRAPDAPPPPPSTEQPQPATEAPPLVGPEI